MNFDVISYLTHLESLQFKNKGLDLRIIQLLLSITTPLKIKTLVIIDGGRTSYSDDEKLLLKLLIQRIGAYIEILVLDIYEDELRRELFDTIIDFCDKIKFLHLCNIDHINIPQISKIIFNFSSYLKYLTIEVKLDTTQIIWNVYGAELLKELR